MFEAILNIGLFDITILFLMVVCAFSFLTVENLRQNKWELTLVSKKYIAVIVVLCGAMLFAKLTIALFT